MDISPPSPGRFSAPASPPPAGGDRTSAPIELSSDNSPIVQLLGPSVPHEEGEAAAREGRGTHDPSPAITEASSQTPIPSGESDSTGTSGRDAKHAISISSDHSSFHSSDRVSIPDMGPARRGGKMTLGRPTDQFEEASPAVLAQVRYLNVIPARDMKSVTPERELSEVVRSLPVLQLFAVTPLMDGAVFNDSLMVEAHQEAEEAMVGITDELNRVGEGFSHYFLRDLVLLLADPSVWIESVHLRRMVDIVGAVLSGGPRTELEGDSDIWASLPPGDWFRLSTFLTATITRGCICTPDVGRKGAFEVEPCKDQFIHDQSLVRPSTQRDLLMAVLAQVLEELKDEGALLPQDSCDRLRATIWRTHEGQIRAWTERKVLSVYKRLSDICLSDILDQLEAEATVEEITDTMWQDIAMETRGKHLGLIAQEKTKAFEEAIEQARADGLHDALASRAAEAAQKGRAYEKMLLTRAEDEAKIEANNVYKAQLESAHTKMKRKAEQEVEVEHAAVIAERHSTLEGSLVSMDLSVWKDYICTQAIQLGLLNESATPVPSPPKCAKVGNAPRTTPQATSSASRGGSSGPAAPFVILKCAPPPP
jgi:hypothetical protein